jgi:cardiolipin synthase C
MANFRDPDIAAAGPVVQDVSSVFDHFWNGDWAVPISALVARLFNESDLEDSGCLSYEHWYGSQPP